MKRHSYHLVLRPEPEGGYTALVPSLPGCVTYGKTLAEARCMACGAVRAYLASLRKHRKRIPTDSESFITTVEA